ncbi:WD repeat-containing protein 73 [Platysternon megacephalum]|uniref:WD repeat-containing protein 73 n=1 Tax=Platysternon megacephalum TaxID=55544 RepID=A0A4D9F218_9SAUR|nr:WD repeat-containing protein 73 [Platysternon megacephalum]
MQQASRPSLEASRSIIIGFEDSIEALERGFFLLKVQRYLCCLRLPTSASASVTPLRGMSEHRRKTSASPGIDTDKEKYILTDRGPMFFLACFSVAAGLALFMYCWNPDPKVIGGAKKILGFSPIIIGRHVRNICMVYMEDTSRKN